MKTKALFILVYILIVSIPIVIYSQESTEVTNIIIEIDTLIEIDTYPAVDDDDRETHGEDEVYQHDDDDNDNNCSIDFDFNRGYNDSNKFRVFLVDVGFVALADGANLNLPAEYDELSLRYPGSYSINVFLFKHILEISKSSIYFDYGLSVNWRKYRFQNSFKIEPKVDNLVLINDGRDYSMNKLHTSYLELPVSFSYRSKTSSFRFGAGVYGFMRMGTSQELKSDNFEKQNIKDDFNLRDFGLGFQTRFGLGPLEFFIQYGFKSIFADNIDNSLRPVNFGISLIGI